MLKNSNAHVLCLKLECHTNSGFLNLIYHQKLRDIYADLGIALRKSYTILF